MLDMRKWGPYFLRMTPTWRGDIRLERSSDKLLKPLNECPEDFVPGVMFEDLSANFS